MLQKEMLEKLMPDEPDLAPILFPALAHQEVQKARRLLRGPSRMAALVRMLYGKASLLRDHQALGNLRASLHYLLHRFMHAAGALLLDPSAQIPMIKY